MKIKRRINGKTSNYDVFTKAEAAKLGLAIVYWKEAHEDEWAYTDDDYVAKCYDRKDYTDKHGNTKTFVKLTCGVGWVSRFSKILFEKN